MIDDILLEAEERMTASVEHTREDLTTIRTGRANPAMFNSVVEIGRASCRERV